MKVDYSKLKLDKKQLQIFKATIDNNQFIPITPYAKQIYAICDKHKRKLIGGSA